AHLTPPAEELLGPRGIADLVAVQRAVALGAEDRQRLDAQRVRAARLDLRSERDGQPLDAVVVGADPQHEARVPRADAGRGPASGPAAARAVPLPLRLARAVGAAVHRERAAHAARFDAADRAAHDRDVAGDGAAGQELDVAIE